MKNMKFNELIQKKQGSLKAFKRNMDARGYVYNYRTMQYWLLNSGSIKLKTAKQVCEVLQCDVNELIQTIPNEKQKKSTRNS